MVLFEKENRRCVRRKYIFKVGLQLSKPHIERLNQIINDGNKIYNSEGSKCQAKSAYTKCSGKVKLT